MPERTPSWLLEGRAGVAVVVGVVVLVALAGWWGWTSRATPVAPPVLVATGTPVPGGAGGAPSSTGGASPGATAPAGQLVVEVVGQVRRPGVVQLPATARVADAIAAAGGLVRGASAGVNLARRLTDGEQVVVGPAALCPATAGTSPGGTVPGGAGPTAPDGVVDLNTATLADLDTLPGVGPVLAQRILDWRTEHGRFTSVDELREVAGIGERTFAELAPRVRV